MFELELFSTPQISSGIPQTLIGHFLSPQTIAAPCDREKHVHIWSVLFCWFSSNQLIQRLSMHCENLPLFYDGALVMNKLHHFMYGCRWLTVLWINQISTSPFPTPSQTNLWGNLFRSPELLQQSHAQIWRKCKNPSMSIVACSEWPSSCMEGMDKFICEGQSWHSPGCQDKREHKGDCTKGWGCLHHNCFLS